MTDRESHRAAVEAGYASLAEYIKKWGDDKMDIAEKMAADIAVKLNGGEWSDGKWYSEGHRKAWMEAVKPQADEIERLRKVLGTIARFSEEWGAFAEEALQQKESE